MADGEWQARAARLERYDSVTEAADLARDLDATRGRSSSPISPTTRATGPTATARPCSKGYWTPASPGRPWAGFTPPPAARRLADAIDGARVTVELGGHTDPGFGGGPLRLTGRVVLVTDGRFVCDGPMWQGMSQSTGRMVVFRVAGVDVLVTSQLVQAIDRQMFLANGIDLAACRVIALKSQQHFRAAFEPHAGQNDLAAPDFARLPYEHVRRPIHPLDPM